MLRRSMINIRAFVGHSFTPDDEQIVQNFLSFFDTIKGIVPHFEWKHARAAEPKEPGAKVLEISKDCNTFIAICTRKEIVVSPDALKASFFHPRSKIVIDANLEWKTSDWIIQEIGLAIGLGMTVIILLEDNCRRPGGLQGNVEFIPFNRASPEKAQRQILEMLTALHPDRVSAQETSLSVAKETSEDAKTFESKIISDAEPNVPDINWDLARFKDEIFWSILKKDKDRTIEISKAFAS